MTATASARMPLPVFLRVHRAACIEARRTGEPLPKIYARWLITGAGLLPQGARPDGWPNEKS